MKRAAFSALATVFVLWPNETLLGAPLERSISSSRQFIVFGADTPMRGTVCALAEQTKANLLRILQERDAWKTPVVVNLQLPQANVPEIPPVALHFSQTGSGLKLQLDLTVAGGVDAPIMQRELLRAVLLEMIYRSQPDLAPGTPFVQPPDWLLDGCLAVNQERAPLAETLTVVVSSNKIVPLEEFLRQKPEQLDSPGRLLYRAYSLALLQWLLESSGGAFRLSAYIRNLGNASNDPLADLKARFPGLGLDPETLWRTQVAKLNSVSRVQLLSFSETERQLDELLQAGIPGSAPSPQVLHLEDCLGAKMSRGQADALNRLGQKLLMLAASANPVMRPVVTEYEQAAQLLARGKRKGLAQRLARLKSTRTNLVARMSQVDDYLNWFEATQSNTGSGVFTEYLKAAGESNERRRHDAISVYLDAMEAQFQN